MRSTLKTIFSLMFIVAMLFFITIVITTNKKESSNPTIVKAETGTHLKTY